MANLRNTYKNSTGSGTSVSVASVAPGGSDRLLYAQVAIRPYTATVSTAVFNTSESATLVDARNITSGNTTRLEVWRLVAPSATSASFVVTVSATASVSVIVSTWDTVDQATPDDAVVKDGATSSATATLAGAITVGGGSDILYLAMGNRDTTPSWTADAGVTEHDVATSGSGSTHVRAVLLTDTNTETGKVLGAFGSAVAYNIIGFNINAAGSATPPVADFSADATTGTQATVFTFTDASTNSPTSWLWDFGDTTSSTSQNPTKSYSADGTYTVTLTATNADGSDDEVKVDYITVLTPPGGAGARYFSRRRRAYAARMVAGG